MSDDEIYVFKGKNIDVIWDGRLCIHIAECGQAKGDLFIGGRQPWCQPDLVKTENVVDVVERCPSGALSYLPKDSTAEEKPCALNTIAVSYKGPYFIRGDIKIDNVADDMKGVSYRAALCRCGASKNKPFCDNSHEEAAFSDYGAVGDKGDGLSEKGGTINIKPIPDGPLQISGNIELYNGSAQLAWSGTQLWLCRCGASKNKPFCDGTHKQIGFKT